MKYEGEGFGCISIIGLLCFGAAFYGLIGGICGGAAGIAGAIPWIVACVAVGMFILSVADARTRISRIEKHLGIDDSTDHQNNEDDSKRIADHTS
jgi:hypothetical protein